MRWPTILVLLLTACIAGCHDPEPSVFETHGTLTINGLPVSNASLALHRIDGDAAAACPVAITRDDGTFNLTTRAPADGAPPGDYVVTLIWHDDSKPVDECECTDPLQHDLLKGRFADAHTSQLRATIRRAKNDLLIEAIVPRESEAEQGVGSLFGPPPERERANRLQ
jgi:hypothetical protein